jgi:hypothetical protein
MSRAMGHAVLLEGEEHGLSVFFRLDDAIFHTYPPTLAAPNLSRTPMASSTPQPMAASRPSKTRPPADPKPDVREACDNASQRLTMAR